ncbi:methyl-accepting chemotaxis protein [Pseudoalteromonas sp. MMG013]|uniref:methyl-accepting chemotaxis protein n=1 Tax=Pseudoalteromonas sp. MMG005 TaxID=2822682 RepID=UPI001B370C4F|nr:methyl-accepting chemotaxis protein [Pseudoalteromonas sp. MMG005]MBQ4848191.1 methyl-accepting chemotaxis protein [Pseudoalteromonas sp. MMG005]MBQ4851603.1 methyl-accepting chemotaxis protein [Pseudoalteromonas sp. MMG012]MBQ4864294.1 methyl-accepting chemotaxis protein [Pseudoalteromonas sp. MMG013]
MGIKLDYLSTLKVKTRLGIGFGFILSLLILLTIMGIIKVNFIDHTLAEITDVNSVKQRYAINYRGSVHDRAIAIRDIAMARSPQEITRFQNEIKELAEFYLESEEKMSKMQRDGIHFSRDELRILNNIDKIQSQTLPLIESIINDKRRGEVMTTTILDSARPAFIEWLNAINEFIDFQEVKNQQLTPEARSVAGGFQELMLSLCALAIAISIFVGLMIERSFRSSLGGEPFEAEQAIKAMANGSLTHTNTDHPTGSILHSLSEMSKTLTTTVRNIVTASQNVSVQVNDVAQGSASVLDAARQQASLTSDTASKLSDMRHSIDQVSQIAHLTENNSSMTTDNAKQGRELVFDAAQEMEKIATTVDEAVNQVKKLEERTKEIGGIVNVISGISEQTNLLALNAAIEAARAGETGRGFAVVADEVRQLAQRTGEATSQIETMISEVQAETAASVSAMETTQPQVESGKERTTKASELLANIEEQAADSLNRIKEVAKATSDQVNVVSDIATAMEQISAMSSDAIHSMQNNEKAVDSLNNLSSQLKGEVDYFKI